MAELEPAPVSRWRAIGTGWDPFDTTNAQFSSGETPKTEIIVTLSVTDQYRYLARSTSAYYVADSDRELYGILDPEPETTKLTRTFKVRGDM